MEKMHVRALAIVLLWSSKHRSGVVCNMTLAEWEKRREKNLNRIVTVATHKMGDKEPATLVVDQQTEDLMNQ